MLQAAKAACHRCVVRIAEDEQAGPSRKRLPHLIPRPPPSRWPGDFCDLVADRRRMIDERPVGLHGHPIANDAVCQARLERVVAYPAHKLVHLGLVVHELDFDASIDRAALALDVGFLHRRNMRLRLADARRGTAEI